MLKVEDVKAITDYCRVLGHSVRQAARVFQRSRNTISKVLQEGLEGLRHRELRRRAPRVLLAEHQDYISDVLQGWQGGLQWGKQKQNALSITNHLREHLGYVGSISQVRRYMQRRRGELGLLVGNVSLDRVKEPNGLCEADWTQAKISLAGVLTTIWLFVMRFRFSGALFVRAYRAMDIECLLDGLQRGFEHFGGVPTVQMDNQKAAVAQVLKGRARTETKLFAAFRAHYGLRTQYTMPGSPDENGSVEATMGPAARWLVPIPAVARMADLNGYLAQCCERYLRHQIRDRTGLVGENFALEQPLLIPLPSRRYDTGKEQRLGVNAQSRFRYRDVWYSVPLAYRGREVVVCGYAEEVLARCDGRLIARHPRGFQKGEMVLEPLHYLPALRVKPHLLDHGRAFQNWTLPLVYERFRQELSRRHNGDGLRQYVEVISLLREFPQAELTAALRRAAATESFSAEAVRFYLRLQERAQDAPELPSLSRWGLPPLQLERPDLSRYESLVGQED
jgi:transposase